MIAKIKECNTIISSTCFYRTWHQRTLQDRDNIKKFFQGYERCNNGVHLYLTGGKMQLCEVPGMSGNDAHYEYI